MIDPCCPLSRTNYQEVLIGRSGNIPHWLVNLTTYFFMERENLSSEQLTALVALLY